MDLIKEDKTRNSILPSLNSTTHIRERERRKKMIKKKKKKKKRKGKK
jgi:hypothetical protein